MKNITIIFAITILLSGCVSKGITYSKKEKIEDNSKTCEKHFYEGQLKTGVIAQLTKIVPGMVNVEINGKLCTASINSTPSFQTNRVHSKIDSITCGNKEIKAEGHLLDIDCVVSLDATHSINNDAIRIIENLSKKAKTSFKKDYAIAKMGMLTVEKDKKVFVVITKPIGFIHKNK